MKLLQIEFYGILSPKVKSIQASESHERGNYPPLERGTDEYVDLLLRSRLHGYATYDPNDVRAELEQQAIPLKSIRIPLQPGLSAAWAPNGYGKTYIFNHLNAMNQYAFGGEYAAGLERFKNHYIVAQLELADENRSNPTPIVPYHALGLVVQNAGSKFSVVVITGNELAPREVSEILRADAAQPPFSIFVRKMSPANGADSSEEILESGWAYARDSKWFNINDPAEDSDDHLYMGHNLRNIANNAIEEFTQCTFDYHETPSESEKDRFEGFLDTMKPTLQEQRIVFLTDAYDRWSSGEQSEVPTLVKNNGDDVSTVVELLNSVHDELALLTDSMSLQTEALDLESRRKELLRYIQHPLVWKTVQVITPVDEASDNLSDAAMFLRQLLTEMLDAHKSMASKTLWNVIKDHKNSIARGSGDWKKWYTELDLPIDESFLDLAPNERTSLILNTLFIPHTEVIVGGNAHVALRSESQGWVELSTALASVQRVLFTRGDFNNNLRVEAILSLQAMLKEHGKQAQDRTLNFMIDIYLGEYDFQTNQNDPFEPLHGNDGYSQLEALLSSDSNYQQYRGYSIARQMIQRATKSEEISFPTRKKIFESESLKSIFYEGEQLRSVADFQKLATTAIEQGFDVLKAHLQPNNPIPDIISCPEWALLFSNSMRKEDVEFEAGVFEALMQDQEEARSRIWDETTPLKAIEDFPSSLPCDFFPTFSAMGINPMFLREEINRCLMPGDAQNSPWGVQVSFPRVRHDPESGLTFGAALPCVLFHPASLDTNTVRPEHLSFGMRSEICLQLVLSRFLHANRQRLIENKGGVHLLVVDEPEIGRAERWVRLLIERFNRLEKQLNNSDSPGNVLVVSHRNVVAERSTALGQYHIMQKVPDEVEWFDD